MACPSGAAFGRRLRQRLGYRLLQGKRARDTVNVFARNVAQHLGSANPYDSLAEGRDLPGGRKRAFPTIPSANGLARGASRGYGVGVNDVFRWPPFFGPGIS